MAKSNLTISFIDVKTRGSKKTHEKSTFLNYIDATLVIAAGGVEILSFRIRNMAVKVLNGSFRMEMPTEKVGDKYIPVCFPKSQVSRKRLTAALKVAYVAHVGAQSQAA